MAVSFTGGERSFPDRFTKKVFGSGWSWPGGVRNFRGPSCGHHRGGFFLGTPWRALVETVWVGIGEVPGTVKSIEIRSVVRNAPPAFMSGVRSISS